MFVGVIVEDQHIHARLSTIASKIHGFHWLTTPLTSLIVRFPCGHLYNSEECPLFRVRLPFRLVGLTVLCLLKIDFVFLEGRWRELLLNTLDSRIYSHELRFRYLLSVQRLLKFLITPIAFNFVIIL